MLNPNAVKVNRKLGANLFDESDIYRLRLNKFTAKQIKELMIDDLINPKTKQGTERLALFVKQILF